MPIGNLIIAKDVITGKEQNDFAVVTAAAAAVVMGNGNDLFVSGVSKVTE